MQYCPVKTNILYKISKTIGTVAIGGTSLTAQKLYDNNRTQLEKTNKLCLYSV